MRYQEKESLLHLYAKQTLHKWLKEIDDKNDFCGLPPFEWRSNYGIFMELPFYETSDHYYFEQSKGLIDYDPPEIDWSKPYEETKYEDPRGKDPLQWFDKSIDRGKILFVPDITIFHKGTPKFLIEIVHTNPVSEQKIDKIIDFFDYGIEVHEVNVKDILKVDKLVRPSKIKTKCILSYQYGTWNRNSSSNNSRNFRKNQIYTGPKIRMPR